MDARHGASEAGRSQIGRRDRPNEVLPKDPALLSDDAQPYARLPGGHQEGWADAFRNVMADIYALIAAHRRDAAARPAAAATSVATFVDGYRSACVIDDSLGASSGKCPGSADLTSPSGAQYITEPLPADTSGPRSFR